MSPSEEGQLQGSLSGLQSVTAILGPLVETGLFAQFGPPTARPHIPGVAWFAAAAFRVIRIALAIRLFARMPSLTRSTEPSKAA